jgi:hypothetical protein
MKELSVSKINRRQFLILTADGASVTSATSWAIGKNNKTSPQIKVSPSKLDKSCDGLSLVPCFLIMLLCFSFKSA